MAQMSATTGSEPDGTTSGADATQDAYCHDHRLLTKTEVHTKKLRQENDGQTFKQCRAILISKLHQWSVRNAKFFR